MNRHLNLKRLNFNEQDFSETLIDFSLRFVYTKQYHCNISLNAKRL